MDSLDAVGLVMLSQSKFGDAKNAIEQVLQARGLRPEHLKVAESYMHSALLHAAEHDFTAALELGNHGLELAQRILGGQNGKSALALIAVAGLYAQAGRADEARERYKNAIPVLEHSFGDRAPIVEQTRQKYLSLSNREE